MMSSKPYQPRPRATKEEVEAKAKEASIALRSSIIAELLAVLGVPENSRSGLCRWRTLDRRVALDWQCQLNPQNYSKREPVIISSMRKQVKGHVRKQATLSGLGNVLDAAIGSLASRGGSA